jgi:rhamnose transport system ATP-binding protein
MVENPIILKLENISKWYPGVVALKDASIDLQAGEVHAVIGENGAGKSTLVKIMTGVIQPTGGDIYLDGEHFVWKDAYDALKRGIIAIYQEPATFPDMNVAENIFLRHQPIHRFTRKINWKKVYRDTSELLQELDASISPTDRIQGLSFAERQLVEIAKALSVNARIIIMDEPTAALSMMESDKLFSIVNRLKADGKSIVFISHRLDDIFKVADRVTTLRDGQVIATKDAKKVDRPELIRMMVGREVSSLFPKTPCSLGEEVLRVESLSKKGQFKDVSFSIRKGEILGVYGLIGAGRTEVMKAVFGLNPPDSGKIFLHAQEVQIDSPAKALEHGIAYLSEERDEEGLILDFPIAGNITLANLKKYSRGIWFDTHEEQLEGIKQIDQLQIKAVSEKQLTMSLSGGNKQKVSLAKCLVTDAKIIILDEATKGIDVAAKAAVHTIMDGLANDGLAVIMISSELPEILGMSDRILVMHNGKVKGFFNADEAGEEKILTLALASSDQGAS